MDFVESYILNPLKFIDLAALMHIIYIFSSRYQFKLEDCKLSTALIFNKIDNNTVNFRA
jgi:hypothetical protein